MMGSHGRPPMMGMFGPGMGSYGPDAGSSGPPPMAEFFHAMMQARSSDNSDDSMPSPFDQDDQNSMPSFPFGHGHSMPPMGRPPMMGPMGSHGPPPMMRGRPPMGMFGPGMGSNGPQQADGSSDPSSLVARVLQAIMQARFTSANNADSSDNYDYDYAGDAQNTDAPPSMPPPPPSMPAPPSMPTPMSIADIFKSIRASRSQSHPTFPLPGMMPDLLVQATPDASAEIDPQSTSSQESVPDNDQISFRSGP